MHILHFIECMNPDHGGPPAIVSRLAAAHTRLDHEVTILTTFESPHTSDAVSAAFAQVPQFDSVRRRSLHAHSIPSRLGPNVYKRMTEWLNIADVVHIHALWDPLLMRAMRYCRRRSIPLCITPHGLLSRYSLGNKTWKKRLALSLAWSKAINGASVLHCLTGDEGADVRALGFTAPVVVLPNGVDADALAGETGADLSSVLPPHASKRFVLFLGRLHQQKGIDILCEAFAQLARVHPDVDLVIAGPDFGEGQRLRGQVSRVSLERRVHFVGPVFGAEKMALFQSALCLCQPSRHEGFSMTVLEALACGLPAVVSTECHFPEVQTRGAGFVVAPDATQTARGIEALITDEPARRRASECARRLIREKYTVDMLAEQLVESYTAAGEGAARAH